MDLRRQKRLREDYLVTLWEMHAGNYGCDQSNKEVCRRIGIDYDTEATIICQYLRGEDFITWVSFESVHLEPQGRREAEQIMESKYAEKEYRVLKKIYDLSGQDTTKIVGFAELVTELGMADREVSGVCNGLEEHGFIEWPGGDYVRIKAAGIHVIESAGKQGPPSAGDNYTLHIGTLTGGVQQGPGNTQNINITNYQPVSEILPQLAALIESVKAEDFLDKDDVLRDLEKAHDVALANPSATPKDAAWTRILTKLNAAKTTMEIAGYVLATHPHWPQIIEFFARHIR